MLDAAIACFTTSGYAGTTMAQIAEQAGVAVQTLYFTFHTKAELLQQTLSIEQYRRFRGPDHDRTR
jgi:AcrR family transcriptional regulator